MFRIYIYILFSKNFLEVITMKKRKFMFVIGIISLVAALSAAFTAFFIVKDKQKKDDEELMEYLDNSIE